MSIDYFSVGRVVEYLPAMLRKLPVTLAVAFSSTALGLVLATLIAAALLFRVPALYQVIKVFISFSRAIPINIQLFVYYYGLPALLAPYLLPLGLNPSRANPIYFVVATYAISSSAFMAVMLSASISGVDPGQSEAALSIGMTGGQMFRRVIGPQAFQIALPEMGNVIVTNLKNTSLAFTVGVIDMVGATRAIATRTHHALEGYVGNALVYFVICLLLEKAFGLLERRYRLRKG
ncbi:MAG: amino acid ABC transporter permease [Oscillospiraceae bacterium]|jgi:L-cystine transport system permease protein|nr:amino acid ABC transporter permease [Oscillospiraceae bacterium]